MVGQIIYLTVLLLIVVGLYIGYQKGFYLVNDVAKSIPIDYEVFREHELPLITLKSKHGVKYTFLVDTGANANYIASSLLPEFSEGEQNVLSEDSFYGAGGTDMSGTYHQLHFTHRNVKLSDEYMATDMEAFQKLSESLRQPIHGIVGTPFLRKHDLTVDLNRMIVWKKL